MIDYRWQHRKKRGEEWVTRCIVRVPTHSKRLGALWLTFKNKSRGF